MTPAELANIYALAFPKSRAWSVEEFEQLLGAPTTVTSFGDNAFLIGRLLGDVAEILTIATHPNFRQQGFAKDCLKKFETEISARGGKSIFLEVAADNESAENLYLKAGFARIATRKRYYARPNGQFVDAIVMKKYFTN